MSAQPHYTRYHPRWYRPPVSVWWWLQKWVYAKFVLRELTSVFVAFFAVVSLWQLRALLEGPEAYADMLARLQSPVFVLLHGIAFLSVLFHSITWFNLAPKAVVLRLGGKRVPDVVIAGLNYFAWLVATGAVAWFLLRG
ncbi:MAG: fumarate reductase subunit C [Terriglobia bacterium]